MTHPKKILLIVETATLAHSARSAMLSRKLDRLGFQVHVATDTHHLATVQFTDSQMHPIYCRSPKEFGKALKSSCLFPFELLERYVAEERILIEKIDPDIVISDLRPSTSVSARISQTPLATLTNAYWSPILNRDPFPMPSIMGALCLPSQLARDCLVNSFRFAFQKSLPLVLRNQGAGMQQLRTKYSLPPIHSYRELITDADAFLYPDISDIFPQIEPDSTHCFIGPLDWTPEAAERFPHVPRKRDRLEIYISLGSSGNRGLLKRIVADLDSAKYQLFVSTAGSEPLSPQANLYQAPYVDGKHLAKRCDIVIHNGGSPSFYQAVLQGTASIGIPMNMDQALCMKYVEKIGAGLSVRADSYSKGRLELAISKISSTDSFIPRQIDHLRSRVHQLNSDTALKASVRMLLSKGTESRMAV